MQTTKVAMRWVAVMAVLVLGACSSEPLPEQSAAGAGGSSATGAGGSSATGAGGIAAQVDAGGNAATDAGGNIPGLVGRWCASSYGELDINADGTYAHTPPNSETSVGTWHTEGPNYLIFIWDGGIASAIATVTGSTLTMYGGSGKLVYNTCP